MPLKRLAELLDKYGLSIEQLKLDTAKDECSAGAFDLGSKRQTHPVVLCMSAIAKYKSTIFDDSKNLSVHFPTDHRVKSLDPFQRIAARAREDPASCSSAVFR